MEKAKSIIGAIVTILLILSVLFKIMHFPGAGPLILLSSSSLAFYMIFISGGMKFELFGTSLGLIKSKNTIAGLSGSVLTIGLLFKIMHWPGAGPMLIAGIGSLLIVCLLYLFTFLTKKESMIVTPGLFYCAISLGVLCILASSMGSSKYSLKNTVSNAINIERNSESLKKKNQKISNQNSVTREIFGATLELTVHIDKLKSKLYQEVDLLPQEIADTISLYYIIAIDNYDKPTYIMGLSDPSVWVKVNGLEEYSAISLGEEINKFNSVIQINTPNINGINTADIITIDGLRDGWEVGTFYHLPLANVILILTQIQFEANVICNAILSSQTKTPIKEKNESKEEE